MKFTFRLATFNADFLFRNHGGGFVLAYFLIDGVEDASLDWVDQVQAFGVGKVQITAVIASVAFANERQCGDAILFLTRTIHDVLGRIQNGRRVALQPPRTPVYFKSKEIRRKMKDFKDLRIHDKWSSVFFDPTQDGVCLDHGFVLREPDASPFVKVTGTNGKLDSVVLIDEFPMGHVNASGSEASVWVFELSFAISLVIWFRFRFRMGFGFSIGVRNELTFRMGFWFWFGRTLFT